MEVRSSGPVAAISGGYITNPQVLPQMCRAAGNANGSRDESHNLTNVSQRKRRAFGLRLRLASSAAPEAEARLPPGPQPSLSGEHACHREIRVRHDAPVAPQ